MKRPPSPLPLQAFPEPATAKPAPKVVQRDPYLEPFRAYLDRRIKQWKDCENLFLQDHPTLKDFASGHFYFGLHKQKDHWVFREWAPNATRILLIGTFSQWLEDPRFELKRAPRPGVWELVLPLDAVHHLDFFKLKVYWHGGEGERIPSYASFVVQDQQTHIFAAQVWDPAEPYRFKHSAPSTPASAPLVYEAHVGMAQLEGKVSSYREFRQYTLPRIAKAGYDTIQLMAIQEHPYYGSFGYQVSSLFAPSSRFGSPDELKELVDEAHRLGIRVILDLVHSHAVRNEQEGLGRFDGTRTQYFHDGSKGEHPAWGTLCYDYAKHEVIHFLLSNCRYWLEEFRFDGFRFDGVTSMLYRHHGLGKNFVSYDDYFSSDLDEDAVNYLCLANLLIHQINPATLTVAEDMSGLPGMAAPLEDGGVGFDFRLAMGIPDLWTKLLKEVPDENWNMGHLFRELTQRRKDEKVISYVESHDQAIVGDQTTIFRMIGRDMYSRMRKDQRSLKVDRGLALHKMMRLVTIGTAPGGYLNFMGNEFGHPEWIDFPREGNGWSYHYARRQWNLQDDPLLTYHFLGDFDREMILLVKTHHLLVANDPQVRVIHCDDHVLGFERGDHLFVFNFDPGRTFVDYAVVCRPGTYSLALDTDAPKFGGFSRVPEKLDLVSFGDPCSPTGYKLSLHLPARSAQVYRFIPLAERDRE